MTAAPQAEPGAQTFDQQVAGVMAMARCGTVLLLQLVPPWPLQVRWLEHQLAQLEPSALLHDGESVLAVVAPGLDAAQGWRLMERLRERATRHRLNLLVGLATWPVQGSRPMQVVAAAAAALHDEQLRLQPDRGDELLFEIDGHRLTLGVAGELLTG